MSFFSALILVSNLHSPVYTLTGSMGCYTLYGCGCVFVAWKTSLDFMWKELVSFKDN